MAVPSSPDLSFVCINSKKSQNPTSYRIAKTLPLLSFLYLNSRPLVAKSSGCSSTVLEDETRTNASVIGIDIKLQSFHPATHVPDSEELNGLICSLFRDSQTEELAYDYYEKARLKPDFVPHKTTLRLVARYLIRSKKWGSLFSFCEHVKSFQVLPDGATCCMLISASIKARKFKLVNTFLQLALADVEIAVLAFDCAMKCYNQLHMYSSSVVLYERMKCAGIDLDTACYCGIMEAYLKMGNYDKSISMFQEFESRKLECGLLSLNTQIYWILCESLGKLGRCFEALEFFREMPKNGIPENHSHYSSLISSFASAGEVKIAEELLEEAESKNMLRDPALFLKLVLMYVEQGLIEKSLNVVYVMKRVNIRVSDCIFCAIINGFSKRRGLKVAAKVYEHLIAQGCEPGQVTYASIQNIYCRLGLYSKAEMIFSEMEQKGFDKCMVAYSSMISMYGKTGRLRDAMRLVAKMKERGCEPNVWIYNSLLSMHGKALNLRQVEKTWKEMKRRKVLPDRVSYTSVISAYSKARELETCMKFYNEFKLNGGVTDRAMAGIMVAVFSKMNRVDELVKLLQDMKMEGTKLDGRLYRSAMNSLRDAGLQVQARWLHDNFNAMSYS